MRNGGKASGAEDCVEYARSYVRGFITTYMAWFLGLDAEDGFWSDYFWPLERLWTVNRAQKDISIMRGKGLIDVNRLRFTEGGWGCMEHALVEFLRHEFNGVNIVKEYPQVALVAPGFVYENGVDLLDVANALTAEPAAKEKLLSNSSVLQFLMKAVEAPEVSYNSPGFMKIRIFTGSFVRSFMNLRAGRNPDAAYGVTLKYTPSRWLTPVIPYLINMGLEWHPYLSFCSPHPYKQDELFQLFMCVNLGSEDYEAVG
jgi:hypothetical protein